MSLVNLLPGFHSVSSRMPWNLYKVLSERVDVEI